MALAIFRANSAAFWNEPVLVIWIVLGLIGWLFCFAFFTVGRRDRKRLEGMMARQRDKELYRMLWKEHEIVTVLERGRTKSFIRNPWGFVEEVENDDLTELSDPKERIKIVPVSPDER